jgi:DNA-binding CsgD family transcriptional regulator
VFDALSARPWAERTRSELHAVGAPTAPAPPAALQTLTAKELQVAIAVGHGMSNREAAAALFVSPKTVEHHLGRVYAKLGVSTRTQLVNYLNSATARRQADSRQNRQSA